jgi:hypothetical protein
MSKNWTEVIKPKPLIGRENVQAIQGSMERTALWQVEDGYHAKLDAMIKSLALGSDSAARGRFLAAMTAPIQQIIPYVSLYDRFFVSNTFGLGEDVLHPTETVINIAYESHPQAEVFLNQPNFLFTRPTFTTFNSGVRIPWDLLATAGWNLLERQMNYVSWELARKRDAKAKTAIDNAITAGHNLTHTGGLVKTSVDFIIRESNEIGFPVKQAVINPGRLMEMQAWTWVMPTLSPEVANQLVYNFYVGNYGGVDWFVNPNAPADTVYLGGAAEQIGWHDLKGSPRTDRDTDVTKGEDFVVMRDPLHAWTVEVALSLWKINII